MWIELIQPNDELEEITGLERNTIQQFKSIAEKTSCTRVQDLSYGHHREVAKLTPEKHCGYTWSR